MVGVRNRWALCVGILSLAGLGACTPTRLPHDVPIYVEFDTSGIPPVNAPNTAAIAVPIDPPAPAAKPPKGDAAAPPPEAPPPAVLAPSPNVTTGHIAMPVQQAVTGKGSPAGTMVLTGTLRAIEHRDGRSCAEPSPDIGLSTTAALALAAQASADTAGGVAKPSVNGSLNESIASTAMALAGRNATVLLARDLTFRLCELSLNYPPGSAEFATGAQELQRVIDLVKVIADTESKQADADQKNAAANQANADALKTATQAAFLPGVLPPQTPPGTLDTEIATIVAKFAPAGTVDTKSLKTTIDKLVAGKLIPQNEEDDVLAQVTADALKATLESYQDPLVTYIFKTM